MPLDYPQIAGIPASYGRKAVVKHLYVGSSPV